MEKSVEVLATLLNQKPEVVEKAIGEDGELDKLVDQYKDTHKIFTSEELAKKIDNANREHVDKLATDGKPIPSHIYNYVKGNAFEKMEKDWAREHEIEKWEGFTDLKSQIIEKEIAKSGKAAGDGVVKEMGDKIKDLQDRILKESKRADEAEETERGKVAGTMIDMDVDAGIIGVDLDAEGEKLELQRDLLDASFKKYHTFEYKDNKTIVFDKDGNLLKNKVGEPLSVSEVLNDFAPKRFDIKQVSKGGRGGSSTEGKPDGTLKTVTNMDELAEYAASKDILPGTGDFLDLMIAVKKENPSFK